jgi:hypothetical protein
LRLERAVRDRRCWQAGQDAPSDAEFSSEDFSVRRVYDVAENKIGIHVKATNEFGLYSTYVSDDDKFYESYYRSDSTFENEQYLHRLDGALRADAFKRPR